MAEKESNDTESKETENAEVKSEAPRPEKKFEGRGKEDDNTIFVGNKPVMSYVLATVMQFNNKAQEVKIKARGRTISKAVDVAEIVKNRFVDGSKVSDIKISTERLSGERGETNVSTIEIVMNV